MAVEPEKSDDSGGKNAWGQMASYAQLGMVFPAATIIGWLIGAALDRWLHMVGLILGIVAGFVELIRTVMKNS